MARIRQVLILLPCLLMLALACHMFRRATIRSFFRDGPGGAAPSLTQPTHPSAGMPAALRTRVVLIDGLNLTTAGQLAALNSACAQGIDVVVDNGFPSVSLPVQHVLWTGLTQHQSGVMYRIAALAVPPAGALPAQVAGSLGIAESHNEIVNSFGFAHVMAPVPARASTPEQVAWKQQGFAAAAVTAVAGLRPLVFVHVLKVDEAGHVSGSGSEPYRRAAHEADALLGQLLAAQPDRQDTRWFVLSDHGHRKAGGHADAEPEIRFVRLCVFGGGLLPLRARTAIHLVDVHRALADSLAVVPHGSSAGRPWWFALSHPDAHATLVGPGATRWTLAGSLWLTALLLTMWLCRTCLVLWPWWGLVGGLCFVGTRGAITLSNPAVYPPLGLATATALAPALLMLTIQSAWALRSHAPVRVVGAALCGPLMLLCGSAVLCGAAQATLGWQAPPPLVPIWSAVVSVVATACTTACLALALSLVLALLLALRAPKRDSVPS